MTPAKTLLTLLCGLALTGCVTLQGVHKKAEAKLVGTPVASLVALYGYPLKVGEGEGIFDIGRSYRAVNGLSVSTVTGYVGQAPINATVTTPVTYGVQPVFCSLRVRSDAEGIIQSVGLTGPAELCQQRLQAVL